MDSTIIKEEKRSFLNVVAFTLTVEDRRPDLTEEQARFKLGYKYKVTVALKFFKKRYSMIFHTVSVGSFYEM